MSDLGYEAVTEYTVRVVYRAAKGVDVGDVIHDAVRVALGPDIVMTRTWKTAKMDTWLGWRDSQAPSLGGS